MQPAGNDGVGRDKIVQGDEIHGDKIAGDKVIGDKIVLTGEQAYLVHGLPNPYLGLRSFTYDDRDLYAGRQVAVSQALARLTDPGTPLSLLFITGASGSGKSSFAQAGLLPALEKHYQARHLQPQRAVFWPSTDPIARLADALAQLGLPVVTPAALNSWNAADFAVFLSEETPLGQVNLLVLDQFEESFTQSPPEGRQKLFEFLANLPPFTQARTHIIVTLRSDYLDELFAIQPLWEIAKRGIELRTMTLAELKDAIQRPLQARAAQDPQYRLHYFEPALIQHLAQDAGQDATFLPLLQMALQELWQGGSLTLAAYPGLAGAIRQRAETVYAYLDYDASQPEQARSEADQAEILGLMLDLIGVSLDDDPRRDVRRRRPRSDLESGSPLRHRLIDDLVAARLLSIPQQSGAGAETEMVDIIHETLIHHWERLHKAVAERRQALQQRARFEQGLAEWLAHQEDNDYLLNGVRLAEARGLNAQDDIALHSAEARRFLEASNAQAEAVHRHELEQARALAEERQKRIEVEARTTGRLRRFSLALTGLLFVTVAILAFALWQLRQTQASRLVTHIQTAFIARNLTLATHLALQAERLFNSQEAAQILEQIPFEGPGTGQALFIASRTGSSSDITSLAWSSDRRLASATSDTTISLWDLTSSQPVQTLKGHSSKVRSMAWSSDGRLASASEDGIIVIWDLSTGEPAQILESRAGLVNQVAWSMDGRLASASANGALIIWDVAAGQPTQTLRGFGEVVSVAWSADGRLASGSGDGKITLWDLKKGQPERVLAGHTGLVAALAWSPDGRLGSSAWDGKVIVWETVPRVSLNINLADSTTLTVTTPLTTPVQTGTNGDLPRQILEGHVAKALSIAWSPDGRLVSGAEDGTVIVWDLDSAQPAQMLRGHLGAVLNLAWSSDGRLASGSADGTATLWNLEGGKPAPTLRGHTAIVTSVAWAPDRRLASTAWDRKVIVWDTAGNQPMQILSGHSGAVYQAAWSSANHLASGSCGERTSLGQCKRGEIIVWDLNNSRPELTLPGHTSWVNTVAWSPDGWLASGAQDGTIILWDLDHQEPAVTLSGHSQGVSSLAWSPDGQLASGSADGNVILWDLNSGNPAQILESHAAPITAVAWAKDGRLASSALDGTLIIWDLATGKPARTLNNANLAIYSLAWAEDGRLAAGYDDARILIWDASMVDGTVTNDSGKNSDGFAQAFSGHNDAVISLAWSPDGHLASGSLDRTVRILPAVYTRSPCSWLPRNLSETEWTGAIGRAYTYLPTCPNLPAPAIQDPWLSGSSRWEIIGAIATGLILLTLVGWGGDRLLRWGLNRKAAHDSQATQSQ